MYLKMCIFLNFVNIRIVASLEENKFKIIMNVISYSLIHDFGNFSVYYLNFYHLEEHLGMGEKVRLSSICLISILLRCFDFKGFFPVISFNGLGALFCFFLA